MYIVLHNTDIGICISIIWLFAVCRQYSRIRNLLKDPRHDCVLFANEFQEYSYCPREKGESLETWQTGYVLIATVNTSDL